MTFNQLHESAQRGIVPKEIKEDTAKPYEQLTYYQLREYEVAKHKQMRTPAELESRLSQIRKDYALNMGAHDRGVNAIKQRAEFMLRIESAANEYGIKRTREAADKLHDAIYNLHDFWEVPEDEFSDEYCC